MSAKRVEMDRLLELVRLHRLKTGARETARLLSMSPNTERPYRLALDEAGLLAGDPNELPPLEELKAAVVAFLPPASAPQSTSTAEKWRDEI